VSRHTVREALRALRTEHLVASRQGSGTIVLPPRAAHRLILDAMSVNDLAVFSPSTKLTIDSAKIEQIGPTLAAELEIDPGEWFVLRGRGVGANDGFPYCTSVHYIDRRYAGILRLIESYPGPIFRLIEDMYAQRTSEIDQEITAGLIGKADAAILNTSEGSAAIKIKRTCRVATGEIVQVTQHMHPAERFVWFSRMIRE
jgi:DNA-binding GntR family transcriptional regulator